MRTARYGRTLTIAAAFVGALAAGALVAQASTSAYPQNATPTTNDAATTGSTASASMQSVDGKVVSTSASILVIETDAGKRLTFNVDSSSAQPASIAAGDRVSVRYSTVAGASHADNVVLAAASTATMADDSTRATRSTDVADPTTTAPAATDTALPKTASPLPLVLLVGTLAALVAFGVHLSRERV